MQGRAVILCLSAVILPWAALAGPVLFVTPVSQAVPLGAPASVLVRISGLGEAVAPSLGGYDIFIGYDPAIIQFNTLEFGDPVFGNQLDLGYPPPGSTVQLVSVDPPGSLGILEISLSSPTDLDDLQLAGFALATINFTSVGLGRSDLAIRSFLLSDAIGQAIEDVTLSDASVTVVPEPSTMLLLGFALAGLAAARRLSMRHRK